MEREGGRVGGTLTRKNKLVGILDEAVTCAKVKVCGRDAAAGSPTYHLPCKLNNYKVGTTRDDNVYSKCAAK